MASDFYESIKVNVNTILRQLACEKKEINASKSDRMIDPGPAKYISHIMHVKMIVVNFFV